MGYDTNALRHRALCLAVVKRALEDIRAIPREKWREEQAKARAHNDKSERLKIRRELCAAIQAYRWLRSNSVAEWSFRWTADYGAIEAPEDLASEYLRKKRPRAKR